jgi:hypothetical protein
MGIIIRQIIFVALILIISPLSLYASWNGPSIIIDGQFGTSDDQFGLKQGDVVIELPQVLTVFHDGKILIFDPVQGKTKLFSNDGTLNKSLPYLGMMAEEASSESVYAFKFEPSAKATYAGVYSVTENKWLWFDDSINLVTSYKLSVAKSDGNLVVWREKGYKYSPTGELLTTYDKKPLALGLKSARRRAESDNKYDTTIQYEDMTYHMILDGDWDNFVRDQNDYLYFFNSYTAKDSVSGEDSTTSLVVKYDSCGKKIGRLDLPISEYEKPTQAELDMPTTTLRVRNEYGPPVIGPDGSVYAYKRTPDTYSILKWTWVDSPDDPQPGPDAPANLTVQPSIDGLYLTWGASPQDPGCVDGYEVERATSAGGIYTSVKTTDPGVLKFNDTGALPGTTYFYKVRAKGGGEFSPHTAEVSGSRIQ